MKSFRWMSAFSALLLSSLAYAGSATDKLDDFFVNVKAMQADFHQVLLDGQGKPVKEADGTLVMQRPGKFRWDYVAPFKQLIVADGKKIWIYDSELEQITVKPIDTALGDTPALLLSGDQPLEEKFLITDLGMTDGVDYVELKPKVADSSFERVRLGFGKDDLQILELLDNFGQTTRLNFTKLRRNPDIDADLFNFIPPPGVDVIGEGAKS
ncbi:MAG: outer membrane lipoprotein chaperone LolA [Gammaproteobacteria bacterium]